MDRKELRARVAKALKGARAAVAALEEIASALDSERAGGTKRLAARPSAEELQRAYDELRSECEGRTGEEIARLIDRFGELHNRDFIRAMVSQVGLPIDTRNLTKQGMLDEIRNVVRQGAAIRSDVRVAGKGETNPAARQAHGPTVDRSPSDPARRSSGLADSDT